MSERHIDIELIMALVDGSLPRDEAAAAEASLDDAARAELAEQRAIKAALADVEPVSMTASERMDIRAAVRQELNLDETPAAAPAPSAPAKAPWYWRALPALGGVAALVLVIGIGLNMGGIRSSGDDGAAADFVDESTGMLEMEESAQLSGESREAPVAATEATTAASLASTTTAATTAETVATEAAADSAFGPTMMVPDQLGEITLDDLDALAAVVDDGAQRILDFAPLTYNQVVPQTTEPGLVCGEVLLESLTDAAEIDYFGRATLNGAMVEVYRVIDLDTVFIYVLVADDCSITAIVEG